jgi:predicted RNA-binding Zn ribbon-like protein
MHSDTYHFPFIAGNLALDFVNTVSYRADAAKAQEQLQRAEDVERWARQAQLPELAANTSSPRLGAAALRRIREVRAHLFAVFHAIANGESVPEDALARVGNALHDCSAKRRLSTDGDDVRWSWRSGTRASDYLLYPVLTSAVDLLTAGARGVVRQCEDSGCGWLFVDRSNARKRRWCSMADCGNRNKARNYYRRELSSS